MLLGLKTRPAVALLTLICQVVAETAEAYRAIPLSKAVEGNTMVCFRKKKKNRQVSTREDEEYDMKVVKTSKHWACTFYSTVGAKCGYVRVRMPYSRRVDKTRIFAVQNTR